MTHTCTRMHAHTHMHTRTHTHKHTQTDTETHTVNVCKMLKGIFNVIEGSHLGFAIISQTMKS